MSIYETIKGVMQEHKKKIEYIQWAVISGISSLVYSEYISLIRQRTIPVKQVLVPSIKNVEHFLAKDGQFIEILSRDLIDQIAKDWVFKEYAEAPELVLFKPENIEILKTVFDLYMIPNICRSIPETITKKFGLNDPNQQLIREDRDVMLFRGQPLSDEYFEYIKDQIILQLLIYLPSIKKEVEIPNGNRDIQMVDSEILTINNEQAICPIHFSPRIFRNEKVMNLMKFVTGTMLREVDTSASTVAIKGDDNEYITWIVDTNVFNQTSLTKLVGIELTTQEVNNEHQET